MTEKSVIREIQELPFLNIHKRIQLLFGEEYGVNVYSTAGQGTDVEITIPANYKTDREKDHEERIAEN